MARIKLSEIPKTWIIDVDGVIFPHNHYLNAKLAAKEKPLPGIKKLFSRIGKEDRIIIMTGRPHKYRKYTQMMLRKFGIRYDLLLTGIPQGERIVINDTKPRGLKTAYGINVKRNSGVKSINVYFGRLKGEKR